MFSRVSRTGIFLGWALISAILFAAVSSDDAESQVPTPEGEWSGFIDQTLTEAALAVKLSRSNEGEWSGFIDIPEQEITNASLRGVTVENDSVAFLLNVPGGVATFRGTLKDADQEIVGQVQLGRRKLPFKLTRGAAQFTYKEPPVAAISKADVEGLPSNRPSLASTNHPAIQYSTTALNDPIAELNRKIEAGTTRLAFEENGGYLRSVLGALNISIDTQMVVFSKTSVQAARISPTNPRALFFRDDMAVGFIRNAPFLEFVAQDPNRGAIFYMLDQRDVAQPRFVRRDSCLNCHVSRNSMDVPGMLIRSVVTGTDGKAFDQFGSYYTDDRSPMEERWGGWYVTGTAGSARHLGNAMLVDKNKPEALSAGNQTVRSLTDRFDTDAYASPYSDIVALMVFEHQVHMSNLLTRIAWDARAALYQEQQGGIQNITQRLLANDAMETVDYMLFVDEVPLTGGIETSTEFASRFSAEGPHDSKDRTLRQLDLQRRLMRYPCSYMIYSASFDALPAVAKDAIYKRMWLILSGKERDARYRRLAAPDRRAVIEILKDTKKDLPNYFK